MVRRAFVRHTVPDGLAHLVHIRFHAEWYRTEREGPEHARRTHRISLSDPEAIQAQIVPRLHSCGVAGRGGGGTHLPPEGGPRGGGEGPKTAAAGRGRGGGAPDELPTQSPAG